MSIPAVCVCASVPPPRKKPQNVSVSPPSDPPKEPAEEEAAAEGQEGGTGTEDADSQSEKVLGGRFLWGGGLFMRWGGFF